MCENLTVRDSIRRLQSWVRIRTDYLRGLDFRTGLSATAAGLDAATANDSTSSSGPELRAALAAIQLGPMDQILDIGCGKGDALRDLVKTGVGKVAGLELSDVLLEVCRNNFSRLRLPNEVELIHADAKAFGGYHHFNTFYMYNPFPSPVMRDVLSKMDLNHRQDEVLVVYCNPVCHADLLDFGFWPVMDFLWRHNGVIRVYSNRFHSKRVDGAKNLG